ncbi:SMP-30/gluconolactonase/LRE family protein [Hyphomonas sp. FCG-A18]|uniref:SMP-30/gluconolactonase/LRE family protein n=1 Tax=Hyphomonas sp. FCG-A18 TaxID=3080019 RepID=UPI002B2A2ACC|nr:SMP-30/gluconolactonase/LRE family protein [Hyphomonas sp. FCG-A18]
MSEALLGGRAFLEGPRWREGALYLSDMHGHEVLKLSAKGDVEVLARVEGRPSGLGWLPDGDMLIVSMTDRKLLRRTPAGVVSLHADLSGHVPKRINDMVVDAKGRAYIGNFGFDFEDGDAPVGTTLNRVDPDGSVHTVAEDLMFPNGMVITPDGKTLIVGESWGLCLTAFDIDEAGDLSNRRVWAQLQDRRTPDGICLDDAGGIWIASPITKEFLRVEEGGAITDIILAGRQAIACMLGGEDGKTLFMLSSESTHYEACRDLMSAQVTTTRVEHAGAGWP